MGMPRQDRVRVARVGELPRGYRDLCEESVAEGYGHLKRLEVAWAGGANRFDGPGEALFAAFVDDVLVGIGGINRDPYVAASETGRIRRLFVSRGHRRLGVGRLLVEHALQAAAGHFDVVRVRIPDGAAGAFYEALRFASTSSDTATHRIGAPFV